MVWGRANNTPVTRWAVCLVGQLGKDRTLKHYQPRNRDVGKMKCSNRGVSTGYAKISLRKRVGWMGVILLELTIHDWNIDKNLLLLAKLELATPSILPFFGNLLFRTLYGWPEAR